MKEAKPCEECGHHQRKVDDVTCIEHQRYPLHCGRCRVLKWCVYYVWKQGGFSIGGVHMIYVCSDCLCTD